MFLQFADPTAVEAALEAFCTATPEGALLALVAEADRGNIPQLMKSCSERGIKLLGAVFPELLVDSALHKKGLLLLPLGRAPRHTLISIAGGDSAGEIAAALASGLPIRPAAGTHTVLALFDGMIPNIASIIDALYLQWGDDVRYIGANAGSETFTAIASLFDGQQLVENGILLILLENHRGGQLSHNYRYAARGAPASSIEGNRVAMIDWRPAFEVYQELAREQFGVDITRENFYEFAVHYPLGIVKADGEVLIRVPVGLDESDGSIYCLGEIPANAMLTLMEAIPAGNMDTIESLAGSLRQGPHFAAYLIFYCAGRRLHLHDATADELRALGEVLAPATLVGALSLGEIGASRTSPYPQFHNATIVALPWPGR